MADNHVFEIKHLSKTFGTNAVLKDIDFRVDTGDVTCIIGASGSGKSTLLRCINLLETPTSGEILYHGKGITGKNFNQSAYRAKVGMVFQSFNLFSNMTVLENCMVGVVKVLKKSKEEAKELAMKYLEKVGMAPYVNAKPRQLSGGQKQRVAIARALLKGAPVLIFDDSTSALDVRTEKQLIGEIRECYKDKTVIISAHRLSSVINCDEILYMQDGKIVERGTFDELMKMDGHFAKVYRIQENAKYKEVG